MKTPGACTMTTFRFLTLSLLMHWSLAPAKICTPFQEKVTVGEVLTMAEWGLLCC
jgi:hypothetical protein